MMGALSKVFLGLTTVVAAAEVEVLTDKSFDEALNSSKAYFVKFYAPWCGHCKRLAPDWDKLAKEVDENCVIAKLDATVEVEAAQSMKIRGYPSLKLFKDRMQYEYNGSRSLEAMKKFCTDYKSVSSARKLPQDEGFLEKAQEYATDYLNKVAQIASFEPTVLPLMFFMGVLSGAMVTFFAAKSSGGKSGVSAAKKAAAAAAKTAAAEDKEDKAEPKKEEKKEEKKDK